MRVVDAWIDLTRDLIVAAAGREELAAGNAAPRLALEAAMLDWPTIQPAAEPSGG